MSGRLDQSLDTIIDGQKKAKREQRRRQGKPGRPAGKVTSAPIGGVKKSTKPVKTALKGASTGPSAPHRDSTIVVSGLPHDVNEAQIKEYFQKTVGSVKRVSLRYNQSGQSRGIADIRFSKPNLAAKAAKELNGMLVDQRPMKASTASDTVRTNTNSVQIDVVVTADALPEPAPVKSLGDRVAYANPSARGKSTPLTKGSANPKAQPKSAVAKPNAKNGAKGRVVGKAGKPKPKRMAKAKPKTAEELDAEMTDYFAGGASTETAVATATEPAATGEDLGMEEISVSDDEHLFIL